VVDEFVRGELEGAEERERYRVKFRELSDTLPIVPFEFEAPDLLYVRGKQRYGVDRNVLINRYIQR
jgi:hypothetical protein